MGAGMISKSIFELSSMALATAQKGKEFLRVNEEWQGKPQLAEELGVSVNEWRELLEALNLLLRAQKSLTEELGIYIATIEGFIEKLSQDVAKN